MVFPYDGHFLEGGCGEVETTGVGEMLGVVLTLARHTGGLVLMARTGSIADENSLHVPALEALAAMVVSPGVAVEGIADE